MLISVQTEDFNVTDISKQLTADRSDIGAVVTFTGLVRDLADGDDLVAMELEHYPGMTEQALTDIAQQASARWPLEDVAVIHRVGRLEPGDNIVLVVALSAHRRAAFEACDFIMDYLKTRAPFWKKEVTDSGESWVQSKRSDQVDADRW